MSAPPASHRDHWDSIAYVNGDYLPLREAKVSVLDRGFLFADAVYEVVAVLDGKLLDFDAHFDRLERSRQALDLPLPLTRQEFAALHLELRQRNALTEGLIYSQLSRGAALRSFDFPPSDTAPSLVAFTQHKVLRQDPLVQRGLRVISLPDQRWQRRDIKSVGLLAQSIAKQSAKLAGVDDAWMVEAGYVTEGTSNSAFVITPAGKLLVRPNSSAILPGITRAALLKLVSETDLSIETRRFTVEEAQQAAEAFVTSATSLVMPVVEIDQVAIGNGRPGPYAKRLRDLYIEGAVAKGLA